MDKEKEINEVFVVFSCDQWKSTSSMKLKAICKTRKALNDVLSSMLHKEEIIVDNGSLSYNCKVKELTIKELQNNLVFCHIRIDKLNEEL